MKKQFVCSLIALCASVSAFAQKQVGDRYYPAPEDSPNMVAITHTENFEYACPVTVKDGSEMLPTTIYIDTDFAEGNGYRFAIGFPYNRGVGPMVASEAKVVTVTHARCPGLCLSMELEAADGAKLHAVTQENPVSKEISIVVTEPGSKEVQASGTCKLNEPE